MLGQIIVLIIIKNPQITASMAVIFDRTILSAPEVVIFGSVQVVFFYCPFLDFLNHGVTTVTVGVTSFTNHSVALVTYFLKRTSKLYNQQPLRL